MMFRKFFILAIVSLLGIAGKTQGVRRVLTPMADGGILMINNPTGGWYKQINAGDTLILPTGYNYTYFYMEGYNGVAGKPIVILNQSGQVKLTSGFSFKSCSFIKFSGKGSQDFYGFVVSNPAANDNQGVALQIGGVSHDFEVEGMYVYRKTYGIWAKQDPTCDPAMNFPSFVMHDVNIHDCFFKNIYQDCIYAGNTDPLGNRNTVCNGVVMHYKPIRVGNFHIHHLIIDSCNRTGIQLSGADSGFNEIDHNKITRCGYEWNQWQGTGISLGGLTRNTYVHDNTIDQTFLYGIFDLGQGTNRIENNTVRNSGFLEIDPFTNKDSLLQQIKTQTGYLLSYDGQLLQNTFSAPNNIVVSPDYMDTVTSNVIDSARAIIRNNVLGRNAATGGYNIDMWNYAKAPYGSGNVVCGNTREDGTDAAVRVAAGVNIAPCVIKPQTLPVKLLSFTAAKQGNNALLQWKTDQEVNLSRYDVERSTNGTTYSAIGTVYANGANQYQFIDAGNLSGTNYYRLKMIDQDGKYSYSNIVALTFNAGERYKVQVYNFLGQLVMELDNVNPYDFKQGLKRGSYIIRYYNKTEAFTEKLIK